MNEPQPTFESGAHGDRAGSIRARLVAGLLRLGMLSSLLMLLLQAGHVYLLEHRAATTRLDDIERSTAAAITAALWSVDHPRVDLLMEEISLRTGVARVTLEANEGERWQRGSPWVEPWLVREVDLRYPATPSVPMGRLQIVIGRDFLMGRIGSQLAVMGPAMLLVLLGLCVLIFRQLRQWVTRPLEQIADYATRLDESQLAEPFRLPGRVSNAEGDEIDRLVSALDAMRAGLHRGWQQRLEHQQEMHRHQAQLESIVEERTQELAARFMELVEAKSLVESARQRAEESAARFADFAGISADGFWETDAELRLTLVSENLARLMGSEVSAMLGRTTAEVYRMRFPDVPDIESYGAPLRAQEPIKDQLLQMRDAAGRRRWVINNGRPLRDAAGRFKGYRGTVTDITERVEIEHAMQASEKRLRTITDNMPALISYIDADRVFRFNNRLYAEWLRRPLDQITGRRVDEVYDAETYARIAPHLDAALTGQRESFELETAERVYRGTYVPNLDRHDRVVGVYGLIHDITRLKQVERELRDAATTDALTGLPNRRQFEALQRVAIERSERSGKGMALMFLDLDRFKQVNDSLGHEAGDTLLRELAARLRRSIRTTDTAARLAGDEFVIILEGLARASEAAGVAEKILASVAEPMTLGDQPYRMSISIGIAMRRVGERDGEALLRRADLGLYAAKAAGRGCFRFADDDDADPGSAASPS